MKRIISMNISMSVRKINKKVVLASILALGLLAIPIVAIAESWQYYTEFTVTNNSSDVQSYLPILTGISGQNLIDAGYINASANDTQMREGSSDKKFGVATGNISLVIPDLLANQSRTYRLYTGFSPQQTSLPIVTGQSGYVTVNDSSNLELGDNFSIEVSGWIDTSLGATSNTTLTAELLLHNSLGGWTPTALVDGNVTILSGFYTDSSGVGSWMMIDFGSETKALDQWQYYVSGTINDIWDIQYSSDNASWDTAFTGFVTDGGAGWKIATFDIVGTYRYWRSYKTDGAVAYNKYYTELQVSSSKLSFVNKPGAFYIAVSSGNITAQIVGTSGNATATGVSIGEHTIDVSANTTHLTMSIDGVIADNVSLSGSNVTDTTNEWTFMQNDVMPYADNISISVNGTQQLYFALNSIISGTNLPDRATDNISNNGAITWGTNPSSILISVGGITGYEPTEATSSTVTSDIVGLFEPPGKWFQTTGAFEGVLTPELLEVIANVETETGMQERSLWLMLMFGVATAVGLSVLIFTGSVLMTIIVILVVLAFGAQSGIIDMAMVFIVGILSVTTFYLAKQH